MGFGLYNYEWTKVEDWSMLAASRFRAPDASPEVTRKDIYDFVDCISRDIARKLNTYSEDAMIEYIKEANMGAIKYVDRVFRFYSYPMEHQAVTNFKGMFRVPKITGYGVEKTVSIYNSLSDEEQKEFLNRIRKL